GASGFGLHLKIPTHMSLPCRKRGEVEQVACLFLMEQTPDRDGFSSNRHLAPTHAWSMIPRVKPEGRLFPKTGAQPGSRPGQAFSGSCPTAKGPAARWCRPSSCPTRSGRTPSRYAARSREERHI